MIPRLLAALAGVLALSGAALAATDPAPSPGETRLAMTIGGRALPRVQNGRQEWAYQWPGVYFQARFKGDAVTLRVDDPGASFNVLIDGRPARSLERPRQATIRLDRLGPGPHTVRLEKRSETPGAPGAFAGFFVGAKADALQPLPSPRRIQFIGDSLMVGYGDAAPGPQCTPDQLFRYTDTQQAFGPLVARHFAAEYQINAYSGLGLVRNYGGGGFSVGHLPDLLPRILFADDADRAPPWSPQVIVIGIGSNDFSPFGDKERWPSRDALIADYEKTYAALIKDLRRQNPRALIVVTWTTDYPPQNTLSGRRVFDALVADKVPGLDHMALPSMKRTGCDYHPDLADHAAVAAGLEAVIAAHPKVWQGG